MSTTEMQHALGLLLDEWREAVTVPYTVVSRIHDLGYRLAQYSYREWVGACTCAWCWEPSPESLRWMADLGIVYWDPRRKAWFYTPDVVAPDAPPPTSEDSVAPESDEVGGAVRA